MSAPQHDSKAFAVAFSAAMLGLVLWPIRENWRDEPQDRFPLSYYPMFSAKRRRRVAETYLLGRTATGERRALHYRLAGSGGLNLVRRQIRRMAAAGRGDEVCHLAARNVVRRGDPDIVRVELVTGHYRLEDYFCGQRAPLEERLRGQADVPWPTT